MVKLSMRFDAGSDKGRLVNDEPEKQVSDEKKESETVVIQVKKTSKKPVVIVMAAVAVLIAALCFYCNFNGENTSVKLPEQIENNLEYGNFDGEIKNGSPNGYGKMIYIKEQLFSKLDAKKRKALPGDKVEGEFKDGDLIQGEVTHKDGSKELIIIGGM